VLGLFSPFSLSQNPAFDEVPAAVDGKTVPCLTTPTVWRHATASLGLVDNIVDGVGEFDGVNLVDEGRYDEEGDDGADVEDEEHSIECQSDQAPFHR